MGDVDDAHVHIAEDEERAAARRPASWCFLVRKMARGNEDSPIGRSRELTET